MKRIAIIAVMVLMSLTASANSVRYFTHAQAQRTVQYLNAQQELMLYCGYEYELETYVLLNEVWMERVNSAYYEIWVYGFDAYTGDEVYMPLDLQCVWLYSAGRMYNAAQYLRFHATVSMPHFAWYIPPYHPYTRRVHRAGYMRSYHYDIHRHGWMPPTPPAHGWGPHTQPPLPPYYMRSRQEPAPAPTEKWTPGVDHPQVSGQSSRSSSNSIPTTRPASTESGNNGTARSGNTRDGGTTTTRESGTTTNTRNASGTTTTRESGTTTNSRNSGSTTTRESGTTTTTRGTSTTPTRNNTGVSTRNTENSNTGSSTRSTDNSNSRNAGTTTRSTTSSTNSNSRSTGTTTNRSTSTSTRNTNNNTGTSSRSSNTNTRQQTR